MLEKAAQIVVVGLKAVGIPAAGNPDVNIAGVHIARAEELTEIGVCYFRQCKIIKSLKILVSSLISSFVFWT